MEEASGAAEDATAERICCPNDKSGSWLAPSSLDLASISLTHFWRFNSCAISPIRQGIQVGITSALRDRTSAIALHMSAVGSKADISAFNQSGHASE